MFPTLLAEPLLKRYTTSPGNVVAGMVACTGKQFCGFAQIETKKQAYGVAEHLVSAFQQLCESAPLASERLRGDDTHAEAANMLRDRISGLDDHPRTLAARVSNFDAALGALRSTSVTSSRTAVAVSFSATMIRSVRNRGLAEIGTRMMHGAV